MRFDTQAGPTNLWGNPSPEEMARAVLINPDRPDEKGGAYTCLRRIAEAIGGTSRPLRDSCIPAGITYLTQFAFHDLLFSGEDTPTGANRLDLALIYGNGPLVDREYYQGPAAPGSPRYLLLLNRTRISDAAPPWGADRDLPRMTRPQRELTGAHPGREALFPSPLSDSNLLLGPDANALGDVAQCCRRDTGRDSEAAISG